VRDNSQTAVRLLEEWLAQDFMSSQFEVYIDEFRHGKSWYTRLLHEQGKDIAESRLDQWIRDYRGSDFATSIVPVAKGMFAMAQADTNSSYARVIDASKLDIVFPTCLELRDTSPYMVMVWNPEVFADKSDSSILSHDWSPKGRLKLQAVTLQAGYDCFGKKTAELGLIFPPQASDMVPDYQDGFSLAIITPTGCIRGHQFAPDGFSPYGYLRYSLGVSTLKSAMCGWTRSAGHFDHVLGFADATDYLANALPSLGEYLTDLAGKLTTLTASDKYSC